MDWNLDGHLDILSGCYWTSGADGGHIQLLAGRGGIDFAPAVTLNDRNGNPLLNTTVNSDDAENGIADNQIETICTHQHAVDYDGDGDLDLVVGCFASSFYYYENVGDADQPDLSGHAVCLPVVSTSMHSAPHLADWDADGDLDLISGTSDGGAILSENKGTRTHPVWSDFQQLIPTPRPESVHVAKSQEDVTPASSTRVWATDWNGDGKLDLLVGDSVTVLRPLSQEKRETLHQRQEEIEAQIDELQMASQQWLPAYHTSKSGEEVDLELQKKFETYVEKFKALYQAKEEVGDTERTGHVWLYVRK